MWLQLYNYKNYILLINVGLGYNRFYINITTKFILIDRFHSRGQQLCKFIGTKESFYIRKEFNSHRIGLVHQNGRRFIDLVHQYGRRDVM